MLKIIVIHIPFLILVISSKENISEKINLNNFCHDLKYASFLLSSHTHLSRTENIYLSSQELKAFTV